MNDVSTATLHDGHPDPETLAAYVDGLLDGPRRVQVEAHVAECRDCREILADTAAFVLDMERQTESSHQAAPEPDPQPAAKVLSFRPRRRGGLLALAAVAAAALIVVRVQPSWLPWGEPDMSGLVAALDQQTTRPSAGRLSGGFAYRPPPVVTRGASGHEVAPDVQIAALQLETAASGGSAAQQGAIGIAALSLGDLDRAIAALQEAVRQAPDNARYASDLSAAYLARAAATDAIDSWQQALQSADRALTIAPSRPEALFNRALALNGLHLTDQARAAWLAYLKVDPDSAWGREAKDLCRC